MRVVFDVAKLRRWMRAHDLRAEGMAHDEIAEKLGMKVEHVKNCLTFPRPNLLEPKSRWWVEHAACAISDTKLFYPPQLGGAAAQVKKEALKLCASCPVKARCRETAESNYEEWGIWGGKDFTPISYRYDVASGNVIVRVRRGDGTFTKVS